MRGINPKNADELLLLCFLFCCFCPPPPTFWPLLVVPFAPGRVGMQLGKEQHPQVSQFSGHSKSHGRTHRKQMEKCVILFEVNKFALLFIKSVNALINTLHLLFTFISFRHVSAFWLLTVDKTRFSWDFRSLRGRSLNVREANLESGVIFAPIGV